MTYGYIRVSTATQAEKGQGLDTQKNAIVEYCNKNGIELKEIFSDAGISGTTAERDGLQELLAVVGKDDTIVVLNTSRLWRSDTVKVLLHHELKQNNVRIKSIEQSNYDLYTKDPNDFLFNGMMELLDQYERMTICKKLARGRKTKAKNGDKPAGNVPFGYKWDNAKVIVDYNNHIVIKEIFKYYAEDKSYSKVKRYCDSRDYRTSTGKLFSVQAIKNIIHNDFYIGIVTHSGKKTQGNHEPIIVDRALFESCQ